MSLFSQRMIVAFAKRWPAVFALIAYLNATVFGTEIIRLKNGASFRSNRKLLMRSLSGRVSGLEEMKRKLDQDPDPACIARIENDWQVIFFPLALQEIPAAGAQTFAGPPPITFKIKKTKALGSGKQLVSLGGVKVMEPFDEWGRRRVSIQTPNHALECIQSITEIGPDYVKIETSEVDWQFGLGLKTIPFETIEKLLRRKVAQDDPDDRLRLASFYIQAEYYDKAFQELDLINSEFPSKKEDVEERRAAYTEYFGREIFRRLKHRKRTGQHQLAESYARLLATQPLGPVLQQDIQKYLQEYEENRKTIERAQLLLADWQSKLNIVDQEKRLEPMRSEVNEQINFETLPRLIAFLQAEVDSDYSPAQRLGLAYSGWILGAANAIPDLDQAFRVWETRNTVLEYLRCEDPGKRYQLLKRLQSAENISAERVLQLIAQLPPILDSTDIQPGGAHAVQTQGNAPAKYWVSLPAEYTHHHNYPMVIALRPRSLPAEATLQFWAGDAQRPELGSQRGYIVIVPEYAEHDQIEYSFGAPAHQCVLDCLIDARKRFAVDSDRVFLAGHGMGADAAFDIGMAHPDEFAGVIPFGGRAINYCEHSWKNAVYTSWFVVGTGFFNGWRDPTNNPVFDRFMRGNKFDFTLVEYIGRNGEALLDEIPKSFDWMDLASHVRAPQPKKFSMKSLRKTDNRFFWLTANRLPRDYILPNPASVTRVMPMEIEAAVLPGNTATNTINLPSITDDYAIRVTPQLIDFDKKLVVNIGGRKKFNDFVKPDTQALLEEFQRTGDRTRLPLAIITP